MATETTGLGSNLTIGGTLTCAGVTNSGSTTLTGNQTVAGNITTARGVSSGTALKVGGAASVATAASTEISNTATETPFSLVYNMPANMLTAGTIVRVRYQGIATATHTTDTLTIKLVIGGTTTNATGTALITTAAVDVADNNIFTGEVSLVCRTAGASGTMVAVGSYTDPGSAGGTVKSAYLASTTVDTTAALPIKVTATWSAADTGNSCRLDILNVEVLGG
jgi:hypothetical protein